MIRVVVAGLGPIGLSCARAVMADSDLCLTGLLDVDPRKAGLSLAELGEAAGGGPCSAAMTAAGAAVQATAETAPQPGTRAGAVPGAAPGAVPGAGVVRVTAEIDRACEGGADLAVVSTTSRFDRVAPLVERFLSRGLAVVSSCEEMLWPWYRHRDTAERLDRVATEAGRAVLGTGVNPGFVMDYLPVVLSTMVRRVERVRVTRRVDASTRRPPLQAKVGATMKPGDFHELARAGRIGHVGLAESLALLVAGLGRRVSPGSVEESIEPVVAQRPIRSALGLVDVGLVAGLHQTARWSGSGLTVELDLTMAVGLEDPKDLIELGGPVPVKLKVPGSIPGDSATVASLVNLGRLLACGSSTARMAPGAGGPGVATPGLSIAGVPGAPGAPGAPGLPGVRPGLRTMLDVPVAGCVGRDAG